VGFPHPASSERLSALFLPLKALPCFWGDLSYIILPLSTYFCSLLKSEKDLDHLGTGTSLQGNRWGYSFEI